MTVTLASKCRCCGGHPFTTYRLKIGHGVGCGYCGFLVDLCESEEQAISKWNETFGDGVPRLVEVRREGYGNEAASS